MATTLPQEKTFKTTGLGDSLGLLVETFNLDLNSNYGAVRATRMKRVVNSDDSADIEIPVGFAFFGGSYYFITDDFVYMGGNSPSDTFTKETTSGAPSDNISENNSDIKVFNGSLYVSALTSVFKKTLAGAWSEPITTQLTSARPHLMEVFNNRLYITDDYVFVHSINTSDVISATGTATLSLGLDDDQWSITMLKAAEDRIWIGLTNIMTGKGLVYEWDGVTENTTTRSYELDSGVVAGTIVNGTPYIVDLRGRLMAFNGAGFKEVARFFKKDERVFTGSNDQTNARFIHPNGIQTTDEGTILIFISNAIENVIGNEDTIPSGIYEYDPNIGLYHKYSISYSPVGGTSVTDYGQQRVATDNIGALFYQRPASPTAGENGILLCGTEYYTNATDTKFGVFCDDTLDTTQKYGYFITSKLFSNGSLDDWQKVYAIYKKLLTSTDKIVVKYRTEETVPTQATITWSDTDTFTTTANLSTYSVGDEVQIIQGTGSGKTAHISSISEAGGTYTVNLDDTFTGATGTAIALVDTWIKAGEVTFTDEQQFKALTMNIKNRSPWIQLKVCLQFTGKNELYKLRVINSTTIKE